MTQALTRISDGVYTPDLSLINYARLSADNRNTQWHHRRYLRTVQSALYDAMVTGRNKIFCLPPRHYKTTFICQYWPAWSLARLPDCKFINLSATKELASDNVQMVRTLLTDDLTEQISNYSLRTRASQSMGRRDYIRNAYGGSMFGIGLDGQITGYGAGASRPGFAGALLIDDPLKAQNAYSKTARDRCLAYFTRALFSRRDKSQTPIILVSQRLHKNDLIGELLRLESQEWDLVTFPARDAERNLLNPYAVTNEELDRLEKLDPFTYCAQYMQDPAGDASEVVDVTRLNRYDGDIAKIQGRAFITIDSAMSTKEYADSSVISCWIANQQGCYHVGSRFGRWDFPQLLDNTRSVYTEFQKQHRNCEIYVEDKVSGTSLHQTLMNECRIKAWRPSDYRFPESKQGRVQHSLPALYSGRIVFTGNTPDDLFDEFKYFRNDMSHDHDDHIDTTTMAVSLWLNWGGRIPIL